MAAVFTPQERSFTLRNGLDIAAKHWKTGTGTPSHDRCFLAFHGHLDNSSSFDLVLPLLLDHIGSEPVEILAIDLAGHGLSSHRTSEDYSLWRDLEDADQIVEQLGWRHHAVLGHSMGGAIASLYAGLYESRVGLCILLDNFGPLTHPVAEEPTRLLEHFASKRGLTKKKAPFHPTVESACISRSKTLYGVEPEYARVMMSRGLAPMIGLDKVTGEPLQGWTARRDPLLTFFPAQTLSDDYCKAFMSRICCPVLALIATNGFQRFMEVIKVRASWMDKAKVTIKLIPGNHSVHLEDAPLVACEISLWLAQQERKGLISRL